MCLSVCLNARECCGLGGQRGHQIPLELDLWNACAPPWGCYESMTVWEWSLGSLQENLVFLTFKSCLQSLERVCRWSVLIVNLTRLRRAWDQ